MCKRDKTITLDIWYIKNDFLQNRFVFIKDLVKFILILQKEGMALEFKKFTKCCILNRNDNKEFILYE